MAIKKARTIAEYAITKWMIEHDFEMEYFKISMDGNKSTIEDENGEKMTLLYDGATREVHVEEI